MTGTHLRQYDAEIVLHVLLPRERCVDVVNSSLMVGIVGVELGVRELAVREPGYSCPDAMVDVERHGTIGDSLVPMDSH